MTAFAAVLIGSRQTEYFLGNKIQNHVRAHWRQARNETFAQEPFDVIIGSVTHTAVSHDRGFAGRECSFGRKIFGGVGFRSAGA